MGDNVNWPDGRARLRGKHQLKSYWERQWTQIHTQDTPLKIMVLSQDRSIACISQVVRDLRGEVLSEGLFEHVVAFERGLIVRMGIKEIIASPVKDGRNDAAPSLSGPASARPSP